MATSGSTSTSYSPISLLTGTTLLAPKTTTTTTTTAPRTTTTMSQPTQGGGYTTTTTKPSTTMSQPTQGGGYGSGVSYSGSSTSVSQPTQGGGYTSSSPATTAPKTTTTAKSASQPTQGGGITGLAIPSSTPRSSASAEPAIKQTMNSLAGLNAAAAKMPGQSKAAIANQFMQALSAAAKEGKAVPNPAGLTSDEADKYRSQFYTQFYSGQPVQSSWPQAPLPDLSSPLYQVGVNTGAGVTPTLVDMGGGKMSIQPGFNTPYMGEEFGGYAPSSFGMYPIGFNTGAADTRGLAAAMSPRQVAPPPAPYGQGINTIGMPAIDYGSLGVKPYGPGVIPGPMPQQNYVAPGNQVIAQPRAPAAPFIPQAVRPGTPGALPANSFGMTAVGGERGLPSVLPSQVQTGGYNLGQLNSRGIADYILKTMTPDRATSQSAGGFDPLSILIGQAKGDEYTGASAAAPPYQPKMYPVMGSGDVLQNAADLWNMVQGKPLERSYIHPFVDQVTAASQTAADNSGAYLTPHPWLSTPDATGATVAAKDLPPSRLITDPASGLTIEAGSTQTPGYDPELSYDLVRLFKQTQPQTSQPTQGGGFPAPAAAPVATENAAPIPYNYPRPVTTGVTTMPLDNIMETLNKKTMFGIGIPPKEEIAAQLKLGVAGLGGTYDPKTGQLVIPHSNSAEAVAAKEALLNPDPNLPKAEYKRALIVKELIEPYIDAATYSTVQPIPNTRPVPPDLTGSAYVSPTGIGAERLAATPPELAIRSVTTVPINPDGSVATTARAPGYISPSGIGAERGIETNGLAYVTGTPNPPFNPNTVGSVAPGQMLSDLIALMPKTVAPAQGKGSTIAGSVDAASLTNPSAVSQMTPDEVRVMTNNMLYNMNLPSRQYGPGGIQDKSSPLMLPELQYLPTDDMKKAVAAATPPKASPDLGEPLFPGEGEVPITSTGDGRGNTTVVGQNNEPLPIETAEPVSVAPGPTAKTVTVQTPAGTTTAKRYTPPAGQFVGTNGYVYEQTSDGSYKRVGKVPGYTDAQLYNAANAGVFRDPNNIPVGDAQKTTKTTTTKRGSSPADKFMSYLQGRFNDSLFHKIFLDDPNVAPWLKNSPELFQQAFNKANPTVTTTSTYGKSIWDNPTEPMGYTSSSYSGTSSNDTGSKGTGDKGSGGSGGTGSGGTGTGGTSGTGTYSPPTQAMIDALYGPYFRNAVFPPAGYDPGVSNEWNYFPTFADGGPIDARLVLGPGGPREDKIPAVIDGVQKAKLSNGEFVMTAAAVKNAGGGDMQLGAKRLMDLNNTLTYGKPVGGPLKVEKVG